MQFYYNPKTQRDLADFGIEVPLQDERYQKVLRFVKTHFADFLWVEPFHEITWDDISLAHTMNYVSRLKSNPEQEVIQSYELIDSEGKYNRYQAELAKKDLSELLNHQIEHVSLTYTAALRALKEKIDFSFCIGGGIHHALPDKGHGFCMVNDIAITLLKLLKMNDISKAIVIDVDAHKGDGTAAIFQNTPEVDTVSIHMKEGWPLNESQNSESFIPSTLDIEVRDSENYLIDLDCGLKKFTATNYDIAIVVQGSDPYEEDVIPSAELLKLTESEMLTRDKMVYKFLNEKNIPQVYVMAGGYGPKSHIPYLNFLSFLRLSLG